MNKVKRLWRRWYVKAAVLTGLFVMIAAPGGGKRGPFH